MRRFDRLVLDAVERLGPGVTVKDVRDYVDERRWLRWESVAIALLRLETDGLVRCDRIPDLARSTGGRYVYSANDLRYLQ